MVKSDSVESGGGGGPLNPGLEEEGNRRQKHIMIAILTVTCEQNRQEIFVQKNRKATARGEYLCKPDTCSMH